VTAVNDQPVNTVPGAQSVDEDASLVFSPANANRIAVADVDAGAASIQVALAATNGIVTLNGTSSLGIVSGANGTHEVAVVGSIANLNVALNGLRFTPTPGYSGPAALQVTTSDLGNTGTPGPLTDADAISITVSAVNDVPVAANDGYTTAAMQTLTVAPIRGVLANDTDVETPPASLTTQVVTAPAHGSLVLSPNGGFTYAPAASFAGTDSFTYRVSDGAAQSSPATVTIAVTPSTCAPRASVKVTTAVANGRLFATIEALPLDGQTNNRLRELRFGQFQNGTVTIDSKSITSASTYTPPPNTTKVELLVGRATPGIPTTVPFEAVDLCGAWPSLVGGGTGAGF
jgi:hypothetical protein